jgi:hypothetical protein
MRRHLLMLLDTLLLDDYFPRNIHGLETTSDGCEDNLSQWRD